MRLKHWSDQSECSLTILVFPLPVNPTDHTCSWKYPPCGNLLALATTLHHNPAGGRGQVSRVKWVGSNKRVEINVCYRTTQAGLHSLEEKDCLVPRPTHLSTDNKEKTSDWLLSMKECSRAWEGENQAYTIVWCVQCLSEDSPSFWGKRVPRI